MFLKGSDRFSLYQQLNKWHINVYFRENTVIGR